MNTKSEKYLSLVNTKMGTKSTFRFSSGNTVPMTQLPFAMASFSPQTNGENGNWFYSPGDISIEGIRCTHIPSPWIGDHGAFTFMPQTDIPYTYEGCRYSCVRRGETVLMPHYIKYRLMRSYSVIELTPRDYGACLRLSFDTGKPYFSVFSAGGECSFRFDKTANALFGCSNQDSGYKCAKDFGQYFVFKFPDGAVDTDGILFSDLNGDNQHGFDTSGEKTAIHIPLNVKNAEINMAISFISEKQALLNLEYEPFDVTKEKAQNIWESYLHRIDIETDDEKLKKSFYSCLYHVFLFPHKCYELDENKKPVHYCPLDGSIREGVRYTDGGFWDTARTTYPLFSLIAKDELPEMLEGFIQDYKDMGYLPRWMAMSERNCMPGTYIDAVMADAAVKGILKGDLLKRAFEGMLKHSRVKSPLEYQGRECVDEYLALGYVPHEAAVESINLTLDAAYGDFCIAQIAEILGEKEIFDEYTKRSKNYKNLFDKKSGFMRSKNADGEMRSEFDALSWGGDYTEACAWQTTFAVQYDLDGMAQLFGGKDLLLKKLTELFAHRPEYHVGAYQREIHEMTEMAVHDFGLCAIADQPSFHLPFIFSYFGDSETTSYWVKKICDEAFSPYDDGYPGDEDCGSMSAWYIFAVLGFYPICPGKNEYVKSKPLADGIKINGQSIKDININIK